MPQVVFICRNKLLHELSFAPRGLDSVLPSDPPPRPWASPLCPLLPFSSLPPNAPYQPRSIVLPPPHLLFVPLCPRCCCSAPCAWSGSSRCYRSPASKSSKTNWRCWRSARCLWTGLLQRRLRKEEKWWWQEGEKEREDGVKANWTGIGRLSFRVLGVSCSGRLGVVRSCVPCVLCPSHSDLVLRA